MKLRLENIWVEPKARVLPQAATAPFTVSLEVKGMLCGL